MIEAFPLQWPLGFERAKNKRLSQFKFTVGQARDSVLYQIDHLRPVGRDVVISSNIPVKKDGHLYASQKPVDGDHGVAVYFTWKNEQYVLACDAYNTIAENLRAVAKSIEAIRGLDRWGASDILRRTFMGFKALPEQAGPSVQAWWQVLGVDNRITLSELQATYRRLAKVYHPDTPNTGDQQMFQRIKEAFDAGYIALQQQ